MALKKMKAIPMRPSFKIIILLTCLTLHPTLHGGHHFSRPEPGTPQEHLERLTILHHDHGKWTVNGTTIGHQDTAVAGFHFYLNVTENKLYVYNEISMKWNPVDAQNEHPIT
jgi:hypothetical protein